MKKKTLSLYCLLMCLLLIFNGCSRFGKPEPKQPDRQQENAIIQKIVRAYKLNQEKALPEVAKLLGELQAVNPEAAMQWQAIMNYWHHINQETDLNYGCLPEGLENTDTLCLVVLGYQLMPDGSIREELEGRLQTALVCAEQYPDALILCTGGGTAPQNRSATEAGQMAAWLEKNGVPHDRILVEDRSLSTVQNAQFSYQLLREQHPEITSVAIVTSDYHIPWGAVLFETQFILADDESPLSVVTHAAFDAHNQEGYNIIQFQGNGILELAGIR